MSTKKQSFVEQHVADITIAIGKLAAALPDIEHLATAHSMSDVDRLVFATSALAFLRQVESAVERIAMRGVQPVTCVVQANTSPAVN